ncbi:pentatricopeptide repeat-containing protein At2g37310 [Ricinus communis]|uniref:Pentatricopeptide repeat-containing protein, putative n=1 Tax=Ricinus communis TaxID=3988 RepID=B9SGU2_RICCO|nr:pentatricopeptide repeat-containing protein At2g37310 [Ricinus communis]EEF37177.1 pentatricopeptide repeat-containing protein, putative [Ricinus communis]|eukprot:XP_002525211.1 pentatricopeptide repeat-containing protein At2g37310 [Ricinus communis]
MRNTSNTLHGQIHRLLTSAAGLDCGIYGHLLHHLTELRLPLQAKQLHARLILFSVTPENYLASKLVALYSKTNHLAFARYVFDQIPHKNTFSYNAMLISYSLHNRHGDALDLFSSLASSNLVNNISITCLLKSLSSFTLSDVKLGKEVHGFVLRTGFDADVFVENALITYYSKCYDLDLSRKVFDRMTKRDVVSWNSMISGYSQGGLYEDCKTLYREMVDFSGFRPNGVTVVSVLQACGQTQDLAFGMEVHKFIVDNQVEIDISVCNALIGLYAKCGSLDYARELFDEMSEKDEVTYGAIISGLMLHGYVDQSLELFRGMKTQILSTWNAVITGLVQNNRHEGVLDLVREMQALGFRPNAVTLSSVLSTIAYFSSLKGGKEIHSYAIKIGYHRNIYVATAIIDMYAKSGYLRGAQRVFDQSKDRSLVIWTAIISAYAVHGDANLALGLFHEMLKQGIQPDPVTFTAVLAACAHCGMVDKAWEIFESMFKKYGIQPLVEHYACVVGALGKARRLSEAKEFVSKMPIEPSAKVWGALLHGASISSDVELGKSVCDYLFEIEPENTGNYVIMANLYSQAGRWKEADEVRERMNKVGLQKIPGSSWIETSEGLRSFIATDTCTENVEEIHVILKGLLGLMRDEGKVLQDMLDEESIYP